MFKPLNTLFISLFLVVFAVSCAEDESYQKQLQNEMEQEPLKTNFTEAIAIIHPTEGNDVSGVVTFDKVGDSVKVQGEIEGLSQGQHGFHVHKFGDCSAPDASSAGGHYNPNNNEHGAPNDSTRHLGDLGNIEANAEGVAVLDFADSRLKLNGPHSIIGRGVIVHQGRDDLTSQPSGDAGSRLGCAVIGVANTETEASE